LRAAIYWQSFAIKGVNDKILKGLKIKFGHFVGWMPRVYCDFTMHRWVTARTFQLNDGALWRISDPPTPAGPIQSFSSGFG
jgi:hypothetical protein